MAYKLLGVEVDPLSLDELLEFITKTVVGNDKLFVASQNFHSIYLSRKNHYLREFQNLAIKRIDGMPIIGIGNLLGYPFEKKHRLTWVDLIEPLMAKAASNKWNVFYLGADEVSVSKGIYILKSKYKDLSIAYRNGFFDTNTLENKEVIDLINSFKPHILIVGMGMPRQEKWIVNNKDSLSANVIMTCGAAIEYVAGTVKTPPRWMGRAGLEAVYRFGENPKRFWFRYLFEPWFVFSLLVKDLTRKYILRKEL